MCLLSQIACFLGSAKSTFTTITAHSFQMLLFSADGEAGMRDTLMATQLTLLPAYAHSPPPTTHTAAAVLCRRRGRPARHAHGHAVDAAAAARRKAAADRAPGGCRRLQHHVRMRCDGTLHTHRHTHYVCSGCAVKRGCRLEAASCKAGAAARTAL